MLEDVATTLPQRCLGQKLLSVTLFSGIKCQSLGDLLLLRPRRYEDRRDIRPIRELSTEEPALARGHITAAGTKRLRGGRTLFEFVVLD